MIAESIVYATFIATFMSQFVLDYKATILDE